MRETTSLGALRSSALYKKVTQSILQLNILQCQEPVTTALTNLDEIGDVAVIAGDHDVMVDAFWPFASTWDGLRNAGSHTPGIWMVV